MYWLKKILLIYFICVGIILCEETKKIAILDFVNISGFKGKWEISRNFPCSLAEKILKTKKYYLVNEKDKINLKQIELDKEENLFVLATQMNADFIIGGKIKEFRIDKTGAYVSASGDLAIMGGGKQFCVYLKEEIWIYEKLSSKIILKETFEEKKIDTNIIFTPFGIVSPEINKQELYVLKNIEYGSEEFKHTLVAKTINDLNQKIIEKILIVCPSAEIKELTNVLLVEDNFVYVNMGSDDEIKIGDKLTVYEKGKEIIDEKTGKILGYTDKKVGQIEVVTIKSSKLCKAKIIEGKVSKGNIVERE